MLNTILGARLLSWHFANAWVFEPAIEMGTASTAILANRSPFKRAEFGSLIRMAVSAVFIGAGITTAYPVFAGTERGMFSSVATDTHREEGMKDQKKIRLGLIGVGNWALFAHFRVLRLLPEYEIVAVYNQRKEAAMAAAKEYGIPHVAESLDALVTDSLVDHVLVLTTSQQHEEGIRAAITAGKDVYCEWPLTPTAAKSAELARLADAARVKTQIGLQRQFAPAFRYVHDLVAQGYVGKVRSARMHVSVNMFGEIRANAVRWSLPIENFMSVVAIFGGHFFPVLFSVVGKPSSFSALTANQFPEVTIKETGEKIQTTSPDELLMHGTLADGGLFSIHIEGGKLSGSGVQIDITGDAGDLKITNTSAFGGVDEDFIVTGAQGDSKPLEHLPTPAKYEWFPRAGLQTGAAELGDLYVALSRDLASGTQTVPTFHYAVWQQQLFEQIQDSSETGKRINLLVRPVLSSV